jgi:hypothetical protein
VQEDKNEDADFGIIMPKPLEAGETVQLSVQYEGDDALRDSGGRGASPICLVKMSKIQARRTLCIQ